MDDNRYTLQNKETIPSISVVISAYNEEDNIKECIESVLRQKVKPEEIIVIDDASTDNTSEICREYHKRWSLIYIRNKKNMGRFNTKIKGIKNSKHDIVILLDGDSTLCEDFIFIVKKYFQDPKVLSLGYLMLNKNKGYIPDVSCFLDLILSPLVRAGACIIYRKDVLGIPEIKKVDEMMPDDIYYYSRMDKLAKKENMKIIYDPKLIVLTEYPKSLKEEIARRFRWGRGRVSLYRHHRIFPIPYLIRTLYTFLLFFEILMYNKYLFLSTLSLIPFFLIYKTIKSFKFIKNRFSMKIFLSVLALSYLRLFCATAGSLYEIIRILTKK